MSGYEVPNSPFAPPAPSVVPPPAPAVPQGRTNILPGVPPPAPSTFLPGVPTPSMTPEVEPVVPDDTSSDDGVVSRAQKRLAKLRKAAPWVSLFWTLVTFFAIYLSFKTNGGFKLGPFLAALLCSPLYIAYVLVMKFMSGSKAPKFNL